MGLSALKGPKSHILPPKKTLGKRSFNQKDIAVAYAKVVCCGDIICIKKALWRNIAKGLSD